MYSKWKPSAIAYVNIHIEFEHDLTVVFMHPVLTYNNYSLNPFQYVAVTGLPDPQPDHAVIMVKFARECFSKMNKLLPGLAEKLGPDTTDLSFRVGLHSGHVVGGVLRGQKSRYQMFGDTVNTGTF